MARPAVLLVDELRAGDWLDRGAPVLTEQRDPAVEFSVGRLIGDRPARWWTLAGIWLAVAVSVGFGLYVNFQAQGREVALGDALLAMIPHYLFWVLVSPPLYRALHCTIEGGNRILWLAMLLAWSAVALLGSTAMSFLSYTLRHELEPTFGRLVDIYVLPPAGPAFWAMNFSILTLALVAFAAVRNLRLRNQALWTATQSELRHAHTETQLAEARLVALQAQINPHFMLNSLNAIAGLVHVGDRERATEAIARLGDLFKIALRHGRDLIVTLGDEVEFLERYLALCDLRFGCRLRYSISVPEGLREQRVPALMMQPLVENAIRHGMAESEPLRVDVRAYAAGKALIVEVEDDGRGVSAEAAAMLPAGHGLANVHERLRLCFGEGADLALEPRLPRGARARIVISGS